MTSNPCHHPLDVVTHCIEEERVLHPLRSAVAVFHLVTFFAAALKRALGIGAKLGTRGEAGTLVNVLTEARRSCQRKACLAKTSGASWGREAALGWYTRVI